MGFWGFGEGASKQEFFNIYNNRKKVGFLIWVAIVLTISWPLFLGIEYNNKNNN